MELRNNNRAIVKILAKVSYRNSRRRNQLMIGAVSLVVILIFSVFSMIVGRYDAEYLMSVRSAGSEVSTYVEDPSPQQIRDIRKLPYIKAAEEEWGIGMMINSDGYQTAGCASIEERTFDELYQPAFTDFCGHFPKNSEEVVMSVESLHLMGIEMPILGQKLHVKIETDEGTTLKKSVVLSGYYTGYRTSSPQDAFFAKSMVDELKQEGKEIYSILLVKQMDPMSREDIEEKLYKDVKTLDEAQRYLGGESPQFFAIYSIAGSYQLAAVCLLLILLCAWLLISNVMSISLSRDIRYYGMLKTLGTTKRQMRQIILRQTIRIGALGIVIGSAAGCLVVFAAVPRILGNMYLGNYGKASAMLAFHPEFLAFAVVFAVLITWLSTMSAVKKVSRVSPIEAFRYTDTMRHTKKGTLHSRWGSRLSCFAWRNVFANRRKAILTFASLFLSILLALTVTVVINGLDTTHEIESHHDFSLFYDDAYKLSELTEEERELYQKTADMNGLAKEADQLEGVKSYRQNYVARIRLNYNDTVWEPLLKSNRAWDGLTRGKADRAWTEYLKKEFPGAVATIDEEGLDELESYVKQRGLDIDLEGVRNGTAAINLHFHELSREMQDAAKSVKGETFSVCDPDGDIIGTFELAGYLDTYGKNLPDVIWLPMRSMCEPGLIVSEAAFEKMNLPKNVNQMVMDVESEHEPAIRETLNNWLNLRKDAVDRTMNKGGNWKVDADRTFSLNSKSEDLEDAHSYIFSMQVIMYSIVSLLLLMGIMNYFNVIATSITARQKEFAVMEAIGMTRKQLRGMLIMEGLYYAAIVSALVMGPGSVIMILIGKYLKADKAYFVFEYPWIAAGLALGLMILFCIMLPLKTYRRVTTDSVIERLRDTRQY